MKSGQIAPSSLGYTAQPDGRGWGVFEPLTGHRTDAYGPDLDGDLTEELARKHARERTHELHLMAAFLGVTQKAFIEALASTRAQIDHLIRRGEL